MPRSPNCPGRTPATSRARPTPTSTASVTDGLSVEPALNSVLIRRRMSGTPRHLRVVKAALALRPQCDEALSGRLPGRRPQGTGGKDA